MRDIFELIESVEIDSVDKSDIRKSAQSYLKLILPSTNKTELRNAIETYLPILENRIKLLQRKAESVGKLYSYISAKKHILNQLLKSSLAFNKINTFNANSSALNNISNEQLDLWSKQENIDKEELNENLTYISSIFYNTLKDAFEYRIDLQHEHNFYLNYEIHLRETKESILEKVDNLIIMRDILTVSLEELQ